jgi:hypothetical protein
VEKFPQINREFARILCNLVIISGIIIKYDKKINGEKINTLENKVNAEIEECHENMGG